MTLTHAPDKLALLLSLVPYLADAGEVSVAEAARHFKVSESDIREAVLLIAVSGVPTVDNIPMPNDMFDIDWDAFEQDDQIVLTNMVAIDDTPRLSRGEVSALIAGLQYLAGIPGNADNQLLHGLQRKLATSSDAGPNALTAQSGASRDLQSLISQAATAERQLQFVYASPSGQAETRQVDPLQLESENGTWYLRAWCHSRDAVRVFRLDRMSEAMMTDAPVGHAPHSVAVPDTLFDESADDFDVTISVARSAITLLGDYVRGVRIPAGDPVEVRIRVAHVHGLKRVICAHPEVMRVVAPPAAVAAVHEWAARGLAAYADQSADTQPTE